MSHDLWKLSHRLSLVGVVGEVVGNVWFLEKVVHSHCDDFFEFTFTQDQVNVSSFVQGIKVDTHVSGYGIT